MAFVWKDCTFWMFTWGTLIIGLVHWSSLEICAICYRSLPKSIKRSIDLCNFGLYDTIQKDKRIYMITLDGQYWWADALIGFQAIFSCIEWLHYSSIFLWWCDDDNDGCEDNNDAKWWWVMMMMMSARWWWWMVVVVGGWCGGSDGGDGVVVKLMMVVVKKQFNDKIKWKSNFE